MYSWTIQGPAIVRAKEKCVVFHAFGCNITVMVTPLSSPKPAPIKVDGVDIDSLNLFTMDDLPSDEPDVNPGWITGLDEEDKVEMVVDLLHENRKCLPVTRTNAKKASKRPFLFTLVHGDILVFYGDDFEVMNVKFTGKVTHCFWQYSLKRAGTSFCEYCVPPSRYYC
jgi:hypothetical protein